MASGDAAAQHESLQHAAPSAEMGTDDHSGAADTVAAAFALLEADEKHNQRSLEADEKWELVEPPQQLRIQTLKTAQRVEEDSQQQQRQQQQQQQQQLSVAMQRIHQLEALLPPEALEALEGLPAALDARVGVSGALTVR